MSRSLIVEADGGSRGNPGVAGYGSLVRDAASGEVLARRAAPLGKESNNVAEYTGLIEGLRAVVEHAPGADVTVRMDSKLVVEQMSGRWKIKHEDMRRLAGEAQELIRQLRADGGAITFEWIPRAKNKDADKLSNDGMDGVTVRQDNWGDDSGEESLAAGEEAKADDAHQTATSAQGSADDAPMPKRQERPSLGKPVRVILVRHGVTDFTTSGKLDGRGGADPGLNEAGRAQAAAAARAIGALVSDDVVVISSSLARAKQTAAPLAGALGVEAHVDADWDEQCFGDWDGLSFKEIVAQDAAGFAALRSRTDYRVAGGGESRDELDARVHAAFDRALIKAQTVVVVTHRIPLMSVFARTLDLSVDAAWRLAVAPASFTGLEVWPDGNASLAFVNDTHHLR